MAPRLYRPLAALSFAWFAPTLAHAAELGEPRVSSYIGQQLVVDVELTALLDAATLVQARLASPDVYRGASITMPAVLSSLNMKVVRRDGRQFLHLTSLRPVDADHLHVFLELRDGTQASVRLATLWLTPNPNPAPVAAPIPVPVKPVPPVPAPKPQPAPLVTKSKPQPAPPVPKPKSKPAPPAPKPQALPLAPRRVVAHPPASRPAVPVPHPPAPSPAAQAAACVKLDAKNEALRVRIGELEQKIKVLQGAIKPGPAITWPERQASLKYVPAPRKAKARHSSNGATPAWIWIAAGGIALAGAGGAFLAIRRRRAKKANKAKKLQTPLVVTPDVMGGVKSRLMSDPEPAEPTLG